MAQGYGRSRDDRRRRANGSVRDSRSTERARRARRSSTSRRPVSVIETGEQEIHSDDVEIVDEITEERPRPSRLPRRRPPVTQTIAGRVRRMDAKRAVVLALVLGVVIVALAPSLRNYYAGRTEYNQIVESNAQLREQEAYYQQKVNEQGDPAYVEAQARARLQFVRPGETPLVMMYPGDAERQAQQQAAEQHARNPWYGNLWESVSTPPDDDR
ncbi:MULTISPECIES: FtsB family cell division protein [unclassified Gordonia (in: high G+C Gram-positive bacteria)]